MGEVWKVVVNNCECPLRCHPIYSDKPCCELRVDTGLEEVEGEHCTEDHCSMRYDDCVADLHAKLEAVEKDERRLIDGFVETEKELKDLANNIAKKHKAEVNKRLAAEAERDELRVRCERAASICRDVEVLLCHDDLIRCNGDCIDCEMNDRAGKVMRKLRYGATLKAAGGE